MIVKHIPLGSSRKSSFKDLVNYICKEGLDSPRLTNFQVDTVRLAVCEAKAVQLQNTRALGDKTFHFIFSFRPGEVVSFEVMRDIEDSLCAALGFDGHQRISMVHRDTESTHIHVAVNKVHPTTFRFHEPYKAYWKMGKEAQRLEKIHRLGRDNHEVRRSVSSGRARDAEVHSGRLSLESWLRRRLSDQLLSQDNWRDFQEILSKNGVRIVERGRGFVFESGGFYCKASSVDKRLGRGRLEASLGPYKRSQTDRVNPRAQGYRRESWFEGSDRLFAHFLKERAEAERQALDKDKRTNSLAFGEIGRGNRLFRQWVRFGVRDRTMRSILYALRGGRMQRRYRAAVAESSHRAKRRRSSRGNGPDFREYLRRKSVQGDMESLRVLRQNAKKEVFREGSLVLSGTMSGSKPHPDAELSKAGTWVFHSFGTVIRCGSEGLSVDEPKNAELEDLLRSFMPLFDGPVRLDRASAHLKDVQEVAASLGMELDLHVSKEEAARLYVLERNGKKEQGLDVLNHRYSRDLGDNEVRYAGQRHYMGHRLGLFDLNGERHVVPISKYDSLRLKKDGVGTHLKLGRARGRKR